MNKPVHSLEAETHEPAADASAEGTNSGDLDSESAFSRNLLWLAWLLVFLIFIGVLALVFSLSKQAQTAAAQQFDAHKTEVVHAIHQRMDAYEQALRGGIGLFNASEAVSRPQWRRYVDALDVHGHYPGIQGIGYSLWLDPASIPAHITKIRAEGFPEYTVHPADVREEYTAIIYLEPFDERNRKAFGYDMWSQEVRHLAMKRARDTGETSISGRVTLVQEIDADVQAGFLMYLSHYGALDANSTPTLRREALKGFVYSPFRMRDLMQGVVGDLNLIRLRIYDGDVRTSDNLMFDSAGSLNDVRGTTPPRFQTTETLSTRGANWTLDFTSLPAFRQGDATDNQPAIVLVAGLICCGLFAFVVWSWGKTRSHALVMAGQMVGSINQQKANLLISNQELEQFAYVASHDLRAPLRNINFIISWIIEDHSQELSTAITDRLGDLRRCSERMDALLNSILEYSRLGGTGKQMQLVDTNQIVADAIGLISPPGGMAISVQEDLPNFHGVSVRMSQVFANLIGNAIKHHDMLYGVIAISGTTRDGECEFRVRDDGPGIDPKFRDRVFEMFKTLRSRDEVEGSGMGLSIVQKTIEQHGGRIWIEDNGQARGATFVFTIALGDQDV